MSDSPNLNLRRVTKTNGSAAHDLHVGSLRQVVLGKHKLDGVKERSHMKIIIDILVKPGILKQDLDYHLMRAIMMTIFLFFGYQKWFPV